MRIPRFQGLRGRLSYANVMATLAFFFALTGGAMAGVKYLTASDPINAGDLAGSTYGNPLIAAGKITTAKFASDAAAPNASALGGHPLSAFPIVVARGTLGVSALIAPDICYTQPFTDVSVPGADPSTDTVLVTPPFNRQILLAQASVSVNPDTGPFIRVSICNYTPDSQDISGNYRYIVFR